MGKTISIILPILLHKKYLLKITTACIKNIINFTSSYNFRLVVVHNQSQLFGGEINKLLRPNDVYIPYKEVNQNIGKCLNSGIEATDSEYLCIMANDVMIHQNWMFYLKRAIDSKEIDFAIPWMWRLGPEFRKKNFEKCSKGSIVPSSFPDGAGNCCLFKRSSYEGVGPFDENIIIHCDRDYWLRIKKGKKYKVGTCLDSHVTHLGSMTWSNEQFDEEKEKIFGWTTSIAHDSDNKYFKKKWGRHA